MKNLKKGLNDPLLLDFIVIFSIVTIVLLYALNARPLAIWDEGLYSGTTQDMRYYSQWLFPTRDGQFSFEYGKPPLLNWFQGLSTMVFGWNKFALRFPTAVGTIIYLLLIWRTGVLIAGRWVGLVAVCLLLMSRSFIGMGRTIWLENLVAPCFAASLLLYGKTFWLSRRLPLSGTILSGIFSGLAILTKQSFGLFAPTALIVSEFFNPKPGKISRGLTYLISLVVSSGWWFVATFFVVRDKAIDSWFGYHIQQRLTETLEGHEATPEAFTASLNWLMDGTPWIAGLLGWVFLMRHIPRDSEAGQLVTRWTALLVIEYIVVGQLISTFLAWYQFVILLPLAIGCAYLIVDAFTKPQYPFWVRWLLPLMIITNRMFAVKRDAFLVAGIAIVLILLWERFQWQRFWKPSFGVFLVVFTGLFGFRAATGYGGGDFRAKIAQEMFNKENVVTVTENSAWRVWRGYLPDALSYKGTIPCDSQPPSPEQVPIQEAIQQAQYVITEIKPENSCPLTNFKPIKQQKNITLWQRLDEIP